MSNSGKYIFESESKVTFTVSSDIEISVVSSLKDFMDFFKFSWIVYKNDDAWVPPLWEEMRDFFKSKNPFWKHANTRLFNAYKDGKLCGRIAAIIDNLFINKENENKNDQDMGKDVVYRFLNHEYYRWEQLLLELSTKIIIKMKELTNGKRESVLIFDDTFFDRMRSKSVELLSWIFDHVDMRNKKGFTNFTGGWSDGYTFIPFIFRLLCSSKKKNILRDANKVKEQSAAHLQIPGQSFHPFL